MPAFPLSRISHKEPRMWRRCGFLTLGRPTDAIRSAIRTSRARMSGGSAASSASTVSVSVSTLRGVVFHYTKSGIDTDEKRPARGSCRSPQRLDLPQPPVQLVPTQGNPAHQHPQHLDAKWRYAIHARECDRKRSPVTRHEAWLVTSEAWTPRAATMSLPSNPRPSIPARA